jgi:hypothetical protein
VLAQIAWAAPLSFLLGVLVGLLLSRRYALVNRRRYDIVPHQVRDYSNDRSAP